MCALCTLTDNHFRYLMRLITGQTKLYTEMVVESTIHHAKDLDRFLGIAGKQSPVALQLGGNSPDKLGRAAAIADAFGYDEINLNVGCPSSRVAVRAAAARPPPPHTPGFLFVVLQVKLVASGWCCVCACVRVAGCGVLWCQANAAAGAGA